MRHYASPWKPFPNGEEFYDIATPLLVARAMEHGNWKKADRVVLSHSDRWDTGPSLPGNYGWQDFEAFHAWLLAQHLPGLTGQTRPELVREITAEHASDWQRWHLERYVRDIKELRVAFAAQGKDLVLRAQGAPLLPATVAVEVGAVVRGMSDDSTWGMARDSVVQTTGRQLATVAFNPTLQMSTLAHWGYDSAVLGNPQWRGAAGTTEPARRHLYDRAFRGTLRLDGRYTSCYTYGFNANAGTMFGMDVNDWNQWYEVRVRHATLTPDAPLGVGLIISTSRYAQPATTAFSGNGDTTAMAPLPELALVADTLRRLQEGGLSVAFAANAACLEKWTGNAPLLLLNPADFSAAEIAAVVALAQRQVPVVVGTGGGELPSALAAAKLITVDGPWLGLVGAAGRAKVAALAGQLRQAVTFPAGTAGYGFRSNGMTFVVLEDWQEQARTVLLRYRATDPKATGLRVVDVNTHLPLTVMPAPASAGVRTWDITVPLRPGDGVLLAVQEDGAAPPPAATGGLK